MPSSCWPSRAASTHNSWTLGCVMRRSRRPTPNQRVVKVGRRRQPGQLLYFGAVESATSGCVGDRGPTTTATVAVTISTPAGELLPDDRFHDTVGTFMDAFAESLAETPGITDYGSFGQASTGELEVWCFIDEPPQTVAGRIDDAVAAAVQATKPRPETPPTQWSYHAKDRCWRRSTRRRR